MVHYGPACLRPAVALPVLYSFGPPVETGSLLQDGIHLVVDALAASDDITRVLLLYDVQYHSVIEAFEKELATKGNVKVVSGKVPSPLLKSTPLNSCERDECACGIATSSSTAPIDPIDASRLSNVDATTKPLILGGLELPTEDFGDDFLLLYLGDDDANGQASRQYLHILVRFLSSSGPQPSHFWRLSPSELRLETQVPGSIQRDLSRRFYQTQKARSATTFGIICQGSLLAQQPIVKLAIKQLQQLLNDHDRTYYNFVVGQLSVHKLANFAEIECFVLIACPEQSWWCRENREVHVPVLTPQEVPIALGLVEWGSTPYSFDIQDFQEGVGATSAKLEGDDAPYFSLVTGQYESSHSKAAESEELNLVALPGQGQLTSYESQAADFLKKREYKGLDTQLGETEAHVAAVGQQGIASRYRKDEDIDS